MELSNVIIGQIVTEKAESQKASNIYTLHVNPKATKVDIKNALRKFYDADVLKVRIIRTRPKSRQHGRSGNVMEKRHRTKKAMVTISQKSKALDLATFKTR